MATETTQYERDLRSARKEWKRSKDSAVKWSRGSRHLPGIPVNVFGEARKPASAPDKFRPEKKASEYGHPTKLTPNLVKLRSGWDLPSNRKRAKIHAMTEIEAATSTSTSASFSSLPSPSPYPSPSLARTLSASASAADAGVLYSFDRSDTPHRSVTLEVFVNQAATAGRETERLVEREYEVLDGEGEALRGKRARALLRRGGTGSVVGTGDGNGNKDGEGTEDEGFELV